MKRKLLLLLLAALLPMMANAYDAYIGGIYYDINDDSSEAYVTFKNDNYNSYSGRVVIPATVKYNSKTYNVTQIGYQAFKDCSNLTSVALPNSISFLDDFAFEKCTSLTSIVIPESVMYILNSSFYYCI